tara:strand:- start:16 stop:639 length:624 start_codon:yes stop_codon:yes gene_type:complete
MEIVSRSLPNWGTVEAKLPEENVKDLWKLIDEAKKKPENMKNILAGNISSSIKLDTNSLTNKDFLETVLPSFVKKYLETFGKHWESSNKNNWNLESFWVNFQKQNEFNPPHKHDGMFSFVIWMQIPTSYEEQRKLPIALESNADNYISNFMFSYTDILGNISNVLYNMEKELEGCMVMFPSKMMHQVFPFYKNKKERISISGNINLK